MKGNPDPGGSLTSKPAWSNTPWRGVRRRRPFFGFGVIIGACGSALTDEEMESHNFN
jgi:hypothetical protein